MSAPHTDHAEDLAHSPQHAFDSPEEVAHAKEHALHNIFFFAGFFSLILLAVAYYEFYSTDNVWIILALAAARSALIAGFLVWLFGHFSFVLRTILFTVFFFGGMVFLSLFDSKMPYFGNPITLPPHVQKDWKP
jgi:drug/metabolite transporter (DMT)-like permease